MDSKQMTIPEALQKAIETHKSGKLQGAERIYRAILQVQPNHPDANHNLGVLAVQVGNPEASLPYFEHAIEANSECDQFWISYVNALTQIGNGREAYNFLKKETLSSAGTERLNMIKGIIDCVLQKQEEYDEFIVNKRSTMTEYVKDNRSQKMIDSIVKLYNNHDYSHAEESCKNFITNYPGSLFGFKSLGIVLAAQNKSEEAIDVLNNCLKISKNDSEIYNALGKCYKDMNCINNAIINYQAALKIQPESASINYNFGLAYQYFGKYNEAIEKFEDVLRFQPDCVDAYLNIGNILYDLGKFEESIAKYKRLLCIDSNSADAFYNIGNALNKLGKFDEAVLQYQYAIKINHSHFNSYYNMGTALRNLGKYNEAIVQYKNAINIKNDFDDAYNNIGVALCCMGKADKAIVQYKKALNIRPENIEAVNNMGIAFHSLGLFSEALKCFKKSLRINHDYADAQSNFLMSLNYSGECSGYDPIAEAKIYNDIVSLGVKNYSHCLKYKSNPGKLRVGFVSGDMSNHPVGYFLEGLLKEISKFRFELFAYSASLVEDDLTQRIKSCFFSWKSIANLSNEMAARLIFNDGIHILIDLSGHTAKNRLPLFAWKPAPVQVSWLGYFATTGVVEMDYLLGDPYVAPIEESDQFIEKVWRLPETYLCFTPPPYRLAIKALPALSNKFITFGCFNNISKINKSVVSVWSQILKQVHNSCIFIKSKYLNNDEAGKYIKNLFLTYGIPSERLRLEGGTLRLAHLEAYNRVDIALDPFPFPGGTTTVEGLWMGVPFITRKGNRFLSHIGESIAHNAGLSDWIAENDEDYIAKTIEKTCNIETLARLRYRLRQQVVDSPLFDAPRFARHFETALWEMWGAWWKNHHSTNFK